MEKQELRTNVLKIAGISKSFPGVKALESVDLDVARGEVVALIGENGAGKSTLMKILAGILSPDSGDIRLDGRSVELRSPRDAARNGIALVHQELELVDTLDVAANIFLGREPAWGGPLKLIDRRQMWTEAETVLRRLGASFSPGVRVDRLPIAHKQLVEIARAISLNTKVILMDEPTSSLTAVEAQRLMEIVFELRDQGVSIIYITHRLGEVQRLADRVVVLRDGRNAGTLQRQDITHDRMIQLMVGRGLTSTSNTAGSRHTGPTSYELRSFRTIAHPNKEVSIEVHSGEILGIAGLVGAGRSELARAVFGLDRRLSGKIWIGNKDVKIESPRDAIDGGIYLIPEDRRELGLITKMSVRENITLPALHRYSSGGLIQKTGEREGATTVCSMLKIKTPSIETEAAALSGGNQQKVVLAKWLSLNPRMIIFDEPTRGIDVAAKAEIYQLLRNLAEKGVAIVMISSDMEEILGNSDRVAVMRSGEIAGVLMRSECSREAIMRLAVA